MRSLRAKLILQVSTIAVLILAALTWVSVTRSSEAQLRSDEAEMRVLARQHANDFDAQA